MSTASRRSQATPKTQSALLESMEEGQVTVGGSSYVVPRPFTVLATQNPVEYEGTFPLPEAQLDRFLVRLSLGYPDPRAEAEVLARGGMGGAQLDSLGPVCGAHDIGRVGVQRSAPAQLSPGSFVDTAHDINEIGIARGVHGDRPVKRGGLVLRDGPEPSQHLEVAAGRDGFRLLRSCGELCEVVVGQLQLGGCDVLFEMCQGAGTGDGHDVGRSGK